MNFRINEEFKFHNLSNTTVELSDRNNFIKNNQVYNVFGPAVNVIKKGDKISMTLMYSYA